MRQALSKTKKNKSKKKGGNKHHKARNVATSGGGSGSKGFGPGSTRGKVAGEDIKAIHRQEGGVDEGGGDETISPQVAASGVEKSV